MLTTLLPFALALEPNPRMTRPYIYFKNRFRLQRCLTLHQACKHLAKRVPDVALCSASLPPEQMVLFLDQLKAHSIQYLIPLLMVVDCKHKVSHILGTGWAGQLGLASSVSSPAELHSTLVRIVQHRSLDEQLGKMVGCTKETIWASTDY